MHHQHVSIRASEAGNDTGSLAWEIPALGVLVAMHTLGWATLQVALHVTPGNVFLCNRPMGQLADALLGRGAGSRECGGQAVMYGRRKLCEGAGDRHYFVCLDKETKFQ